MTSDLTAALSGPPPKEPAGPKLTVDAGPDGGEFTGLVTDRPITPGEYQGAFAKVYELAGLDPDDYRIVDDTVRFSSWEQSAYDNHLKRRSTITLYSYRARFQRITRADRDVENIAELVKIAKANARRKPRQNPSSLTRVVVVSDAQVGKLGSRGGTPELLERIADLLERLDDVMTAQPCEDVLIVDPGDLTEGFSNYKGQQHLNDLSHPSQLRVARAILTDIVTTVAARHNAATVVTVPSNHGAWRDGKEALGRPSDDYGIDCHLAVSEALARDPRFQHVTWVIPDEWDQSVALDVRGARVGVVHGHQRMKPDQIADWWKGQSHGTQPIHDATILLHGHWHHLRVQPSGNRADGQSRWVIQAPAMDSGSDWYRNSSGEDSEPGLLTFTIDDDGRWDHLRLITAPKADDLFTANQADLEVAS